MAVPGTGSTNQSLTFAAAKKVGGKAHTSNLKEIYNETIPSNIQISTDFIFGEDIPQTVTTDTLYTRFSASAGADPTVEYVEFYVQSIAGTTYDANDGTFGDVGFGGGDEAQDPGPHGYQLVLTSSYEASSSNPNAGSGFLVNNQVINASNGGLQLVHPLFGPQTGNNYVLEIYTAHPDEGGLQIPTTSPIEWLVDYYNGTIFVQDYIASAVPTYARGFIYIGKTAKTLITEASSSSGGGGGGGNLSITGDTGSDTVTVGTDTLNFSGSEGIDTTVSTDKVAIKISLSGLNNNTTASDTDTIIVDDNGADTLTKMSRASFLGGGLAKFNSGLTATTMSASSTLQVVGGTTLGSTLSVSGAVSLAGVSSGSIAGPGSYIGLNSSNQLILTSSQGGLAGNPAGSNTQVQFNNSGDFGASSNFTFDGSKLQVVGGISGSGTLEVVGATSLGGTLGVTGSTNLSALTASSIVASGITEGGVIVATAGGLLSEFATLRFGAPGLFVGNNVSLSGSVNFFGGYTDSPDVGASYDSSTGQLNLRGNVFSAGTVKAISGISGSSTLETVGATTLGSTLSVSGSVTLAGASSGSIAGPGSYLGLDSNNQIVLATSSGSGGGAAGNPAGNNTEIQFNNGGVFGASSNLKFSGTTLFVSGTTDISGNVAINMGGLAPTHGLTLPNNSDVTGKTKATAYLTYSSIRYKKEVQPLKDPIGTLKKLDGVSYVWKDTGNLDYGFIAEEVGKVLPEIVEWAQDGKHVNSMDYIRIISFLVEGVKEQDKKIESLENKLDILIEKIDKLNV